ncbi:unnamed protein product [Discosporangium mesarthrocarpum]
MPGNIMAKKWMIIFASAAISQSCAFHVLGGEGLRGITPGRSLNRFKSTCSIFSGCSAISSMYQGHHVGRNRRFPGSETRGRGQRGALLMFDATDLFQLQQTAGQVAANELTNVSPASLCILYGTGLLMSFSPCALSLLPLTVGYIAGTENENGSNESTGFLSSAAFAAGLATVLSLLGLSATLAGRVMGSTSGTGLGGTLLPIMASVLAVVMGLNVLELVSLELPSFEGGLDNILKLPRTARAFLLGSSSALVASPCCTPVLASILGFVASSQDPILGLALLLSYSIGYTTPLMVVGTASGAMSKFMSVRGLSWISPVSGALLISYGTYSGLSAIFGEG